MFDFIGGFLSSTTDLTFCSSWSVSLYILWHILPCFHINGMRKPRCIEGTKGMAGFLDGMRTHFVYIAFIAGCRDFKKAKNQKTNSTGSGDAQSVVEIIYTSSFS